MCPFFGLTDNHQVQLHELIFDFCYYGKISYDSVYTMPVQYRSFYVKKLINMKEKEKGVGQDSAPPKSNIVKGPPINKRPQ